MSFECKVINRSLMVTRESPNHSWRVEPNIFEALKAECIWDAKESSTKLLPRFRIHFDEQHFPDLAAWRNALTSDNSPQQVSFKGKDSLLAELLRDVDFSKPFDASLVADIRQRFTVSGRKAVDVDADLIIHGELGEIPE